MSLLLSERQREADPAAAQGDETMKPKTILYLSLLALALLVLALARWVADGVSSVGGQARRPSYA
jgi:hypothetical protein